MNTILGLIVLLTVTASIAQGADMPSEPTAASKGTTIGEIERLSPAIDSLVPSDAAIEVLADGFDWSEGPVWHKASGQILFSDIPRNAIYAWSESGGLKKQIHPAGYTGSTPRDGESGSNGLAVDAQGRLTLCQHGDRCIARLTTPIDQPPQYETLADKHDGKRFNSPNDLVIHSSGAIYFTDPAYGLVKGFEDPAREIDFCGVYRRDPSGKVSLVTDKLARPNGLAFSPDESTLYVGQSDKERLVITAYRLSVDGGVDAGTVFFDARELAKDRDGSLDGMKVDKQGNLFATGPGGVLVISPLGEHLGTIRTGTLIANCAFGDDGRTLYMTCDRYLCRVKLSTTGCGF